MAAEDRRRNRSQGIIPRTPKVTGVKAAVADAKKTAEKIAFLPTTAGEVERFKRIALLATTDPDAYYAAVVPFCNEVVQQDYQHRPADAATVEEMQRNEAIRLAAKTLGQDAMANYRGKRQ